IFHEMAHRIYDSENIDFQKKFEIFFKQNTKASEESTSELLNGNLLNEAMATALGNGIAYKQFTGNLDPSNWYNDFAINALGKAIYPKIENYLDQKKKIDEDFVDYVLVKYNEILPRELKKLQVLFKNILITADEKIIHSDDIIEILSSHVGYLNPTYSSPFDHPYSIEGFKTLPATRNILLVLSSSEFNRLKSINSIFPEIQNWEKIYFDLNKKTEWVFKGTADNKRIFYIFNVSSKENMLKLLTKLQQSDKLEEKEFLISI
ncbi:MAG: hypothetical protein HQK49_21865, partial [Oligoflexia bacterium]|nr:hypothetical protein [Oligoflexia bacterium]